MSKTVILYGGAFDPPHYAHLWAAQKALLRKIHYRSADELWFLPCYSDAFGEKKLSPAEDRVNMLDIMVRNNPKYSFRVCTDEIEMRNHAGTYAVVKEMYRRYPGYEFVYLIGLDQARDISKWRNSRKLRKIIRFMVVKRYGVYPFGPAGWIRKDPHIFIDNDLTETKEDISSSRLRAAVRECHTSGKYLGDKFLSWLDADVEEYIRRNSLYEPKKEQMV